MLMVWVLAEGQRAVWSAELSAASYEELLKNSPFSQRAAVADVVTTATPLELRGVFVDHGEPFFSLCEVSTRTSRWVGLNEAGNPFTVRSYDPAKGQVKVSYQGRELVLGLKQATIIALAAPAPVVPPPPGAPQPAATSTPPNDEAVRLAQIAEEIGRRRALRAQARQQTGPGQPPTPSPK